MKKFTVRPDGALFLPTYGFLQPFLLSYDVSLSYLI